MAGYLHYQQPAVRVRIKCYAKRVKARRKKVGKLSVKYWNITFGKQHDMR